MLNKYNTEEVDQGFLTIQKTLFEGIHKLATRKVFFWDVGKIVLKNKMCSD